MTETVSETPVETPEAPDGGEQEPETPDEAQDDDGEQKRPETPAPEGRCEAETTAGGYLYRCALDEGHDGEHTFQPVDATDTGEVDEPEDLAHEDEEQARKLSARARSYAKSVGELLGEDLGGFVECELCTGYFPGLHPPAEFTVLSADAQRALRVILKLPSVDNFQADRYSKACETCAGQGKVLTGSHVHGREFLDCLDCNGNGWVPVGTERTLPLSVPEPASVAAAVAGRDDGAPPPDSDPWGRAKGDPLYGVMPGYEDYH